MIKNKARTMCLVVPFTLPCCGRTYVTISKVPSCPENWPKSKCPPELCIQVGFQPDQRENGVCWRCRAEHAGVPAELREKLRPGIDNADVVVGLDELTANDRRKLTEEGGHCWFCGSRNGCETCAADDKNETGSEITEINADEERSNDRKRHRTSMRGKPVNKRLSIRYGGMRSKVSCPC